VHKEAHVLFITGFRAVLTVRPDDFDTVYHTVVGGRREFVSCCSGIRTGKGMYDVRVNPDALHFHSLEISLNSLEKGRNFP
jgi:hypothetical protein